MNQDDASVEWKQLCEEAEVANEAYLQAISVISQKFSEIGRDRSSDNPSDDELLKFEETLKSWDAVKGRMKQFIRENC